MHEHIKDITCDQCDMKFASKAYLIAHKKAKHENLIFNCSFCSSKFSYEHNLKQHLKEIHSDNSKTNFKCDQCPNEYKRKMYLTKHKKEIHGDNVSITCKICGKNLSTQSIFYRHIYNFHGIKSSEYRYHNKNTP